MEHTDILIGLDSMKRLKIGRSQFDLGNSVIDMGTNKVVQSKLAFACMAANRNGNKYIGPKVTLAEPIYLTNQPSGNLRLT